MKLFIDSETKNNELFNEIKRRVPGLSRTGLLNLKALRKRDKLLLLDKLR